MRATQNRFHQLDETEYTCSAKQARKRWTAEGVFGFIMNTPSLNRRNEYPSGVLGGILDLVYIQAQRGASWMESLFAMVEGSSSSTGGG